MTDVLINLVQSNMAEIWEHDEDNNDVVKSSEKTELTM